MKNCLVSYRSYRSDGQHEDALAGEFFGPAGCLMTEDEAQRRVKSLEGRPDRLARIERCASEAEALRRARARLGVPPLRSGGVL